MARAWFAVAVAGVLGLFYVGYGLHSGSPGLAIESVAHGQEAEALKLVYGGQSPGRYQMAVMDGAAPGTAPYLFVCDTASGQCWSMSFVGGQQRWRDLGNPQAANGSKQPAEQPADTQPRLPKPR